MEEQATFTCYIQKKSSNRLQRNLKPMIDHIGKAPAYTCPPDSWGQMVDHCKSHGFPLTSLEGAGKALEFRL